MIPKFPKHPSPRPASADSTNVVSHDYDPKTQQLTITFHGGRKYRYLGVTPAKVASFRNSPSKGSFISEHLTPHHSYQKLP